MFRPESFFISSCCFLLNLIDVRAFTRAFTIHTVFFPGNILAVTTFNGNTKAY